jgi:hypothetical protein
MVNVPGSHWDVKIRIPDIVAHAGKSSGQVIYKGRLGRHVWMMAMLLMVTWWIVIWEPSRKISNGAFMFQAALQGGNNAQPLGCFGFHWARWQQEHRVIATTTPALLGRLVFLGANLACIIDLDKLVSAKG